MTGPDSGRGKEMRRLVILASALALLAQPVLALSCMRPDAVSMYQRAAESEARYVVVLGAFLRDGPDQPLLSEPEAEGMGIPYVYDALFYGDIGSRVGFHTPAELEVTVAVDCLGPWCGTPPADGQEVLAFLQVDENGEYFLMVEACPTWVMTAPDQEVMDRIAACMRGEPCEPDE